MPSALAPFGMAEGIEKDQGMDEFSLAGPTRVVELKHGAVETYEVTPRDFGLKTVDISKIASSHSAQENARRVLDVLTGKYDTPEADFFCMNAGAALYVSGFAENYAKGTQMAKESLASGKAYEKLICLKEMQG